MKNDKLQTWALVAEIIGGIAIVLSLGIVAFELNQGTRQAELNTNAINMSVYQDLYDSVFRLNSSVSTDSDMARLIVASSPGEQDLTREDSMRVNIFFTNLFRHGDLAFSQYQSGTISEAQLQSILGPVRGFTRGNATAKLNWERLRGSGVLQETFIEYLDKVIANET